MSMFHLRIYTKYIQYVSKKINRDLLQTTVDNL